LRPLAFCLLALPVLAAITGYREALPGYRYQFPRDHFEHEDFRTEWWYYTGNVKDAAGKRFGFELVFFRQGQRPRAAGNAGNDSAWAIQDLYLAHAALTDVSGRKFRTDERLNRRGPGIAGASFSDRRIWNGNWSSLWSGSGLDATQTITAITDNFRFHLRLEPIRPVVIHGENGISQKAEEKGRASHYVSFPLLKVSGEIDSRPVSGQAWMDHEWFTEQLSEAQQGWDWFSVQLENNAQLMLFELRRKDGTIDPYSSGTLIGPDGKARHLRREDFSLEPLRKWTKYPVEWRIRVPSAQIDLRCRAVLDNQELKTRLGGPSYWEGAVDYSGSHAGVGYLEMTGYERPVDLR